MCLCMEVNGTELSLLGSIPCSWSYNPSTPQPNKDQKQKELDVGQMEQHTLKNVNNCLNTNSYSYLETSYGQCSNLYLNVVHFFNTTVNQTSVAA